MPQGIITKPASVTSLNSMIAIRIWMAMMPKAMIVTSAPIKRIAIVWMLRKNDMGPLMTVI